jgi:hypothetical protein
MSWLPRSRRGGRPPFSVGFAAIAAGCAILGGGCLWSPAAPLPSTQLGGTITLAVDSVDANGAVLGQALQPSASGLRVRVLSFAGLRDSSASDHGKFSVPVGAGFNWLVVGPSVATSDTFGPWFVGHAAVRGIRLTLRGKGSLAVFPNPVPQGAALRIQLSVAQAERIVLRIRAIDGRSVRTLYDGVLVAGVHAVVWDTRDDGGLQVPAGTYWVTCEGGSPATAAPLGALPVSPGVTPVDSRGSRALVVVTGP